MRHPCNSCLQKRAPRLFRAAIGNLLLASLGVAAFGSTALNGAAPSQVEGSLEKIACPFDVSKALLPVECGRPLEGP